MATPTLSIERTPVLQVVQAAITTILRATTEQLLPYSVGHHHVENEVAPALATISYSLGTQGEKESIMP